jgi:hypothetical protein
MRKLFLVLVLLSFSCEDECTQSAYCEQVSNTSKGGDKVTVCHYGETLEISINALKEHLSHGDTEGACTTLSDDGLTFINGGEVYIPCSYSLPFIHVDDSGKSWLYREIE